MKHDEKDEMIARLIVALNAVSNEAVAYMRDKNNDGSYFLAAVNNANLTVQVAARCIYGEYVQ